MYAGILGITLAKYFSVLHLLGDADFLTVYETDQLHAQVMLSINEFNYGWLIGLVFFSLSFFILGYLVYKSGYIPKILGVLLIITPFGYLIDSFGRFLSPDYDENIKLLTFIGEMLLMLWLLWRSARGFGQELEKK